MQCGGTNKGINFKDLVCALVLITMGHIEEKVKCVYFGITMFNWKLIQSELVCSNKI